MADNTITEENTEFAVAMADLRRLLDKIEHRCWSDERRLPDDRAPEERRLDFQINHLKMGWADLAVVKLRARRRELAVVHRRHTAWLNDQAQR